MLTISARAARSWTGTTHNGKALFDDPLGVTSREPVVMAIMRPFDDSLSQEFGIGYVPFMNDSPDGSSGGSGTPPVVPEPQTGLLLGLGLIMLHWCARDRRGARRVA